MWFTNSPDFFLGILEIDLLMMICGTTLLTSCKLELEAAIVAPTDWLYTVLRLLSLVLQRPWEKEAMVEVDMATSGETTAGTITAGTTTMGHIRTEALRALEALHMASTR